LLPDPNTRPQSEASALNNTIGDAFQLAYQTQQQQLADGVPRKKTFNKISGTINCDWRLFKLCTFKSPAHRSDMTRRLVGLWWLRANATLALILTSSNTRVQRQAHPQAHARYSYSQPENFANCFAR